MDCRSLQYKSFCAATADRAPVCECVRQERSRQPYDKPAEIHDLADAASLLAIAPGLPVTGKVRFICAGTSMYPVIRPKDILRVESATASEIAVNDIIAFSSAGRLFAHRVCRIDRTGYKAVVWTMPDNGSNGTEGPFDDSRISGKVTEVERRGEKIPITRAKPSVLVKLLSFPFILIYNSKKPLLKQLSVLAQYAPLPDDKNRWEIKIHVPSGGNVSDNFYLTLSPAQYLEKCRENKTRTRGIYPKITLSVRDQKKTVCAYSFVRKPAGCPFRGWWLYDWHTASDCIRPGSAIPEIIADNLANAGISCFKTYEALLSGADKKLFDLAGYIIEKNTLRKITAKHARQVTRWQKSFTGRKRERLPYGSSNKL